LSDLVMPEMGGLELAQALQQHNPAVRVVLLSGYPINGEEGELKSAGVVGWIQKSVSLDQLAELINRVLMQGRKV